MQDVHREPYKQGGSVRLRRDGYRLSERGDWMLGEKRLLRRHERVRSRSHRLDLEDD